MKKIFTLIVAISALGISTSLYAQSSIVSGKVTAGDDGSSLPGVNVLVQGTGDGTITDIDGNYKISVESGATLTFSYIGYEGATLAVGSRAVIDVVLQPDIESLNEVVVTAFGVKQEKKSLGYAVQQIESEELNESKQTNVISALQGRIAGVNINTTSGQPGAGANIIIRGMTSLNPGANNQPIIVIDGMIMSNDTDNPSILPSTGSNAFNSAEQGSSSNRLADINPNDIESINILKGPGAAALYGVNGANGAIIITTKSGKKGKPQVSFTSTYGIDQLGIRPEVQTKYREGRFGRLRFRSNGDPLRFQSIGPKVREGIPVYDNIGNFFVNGKRVENSVSVNGGNDVATYYASVSRLDQEGITPFSEWQRTSFRVKTDIKASKKLTIRAGLNYINSGGNRAISGDKSIMSSLSYMTPTFDIRDYRHPDGSMKDFSDGIIDNPRYLAEFVKYEDDVNRINNNIGFNFKVNDWLTIDYSLGNDYYNDTRRRVVPPGIDLSSQNGGFIVDANINRRELNSNLLITATKDISEDLTASLTVGNQVVDRRFHQKISRGEDFTFPDFENVGNTSLFFISERRTQYRYAGVFADAKINYKGIYYLNITARNDWSSALPEASRSFFYPSVSLGVVFSELIAANNILSYGKVRASWAQVGKDAAPHVIGTVYSQDGVFNGVNTFRNGTIAGDENLRSELTTSSEIGADLRFLNNRIGIDFSVYRQNSSDMILSVPISNATGLSRYLTNAGEMENTGVELLITSTPYKSNNLTWDVDVNWSKNQGEVISIQEGIDEIPFYANTSGITYKLVEGGKVGDLYGFVYDRNEEGRLVLDANGYPDRARDEDGAFVSKVVGNALPDFIAGMTNRISYKSFTLSFLLEWRSGGDIFDVGLRNGIRNGVLKDSDRRFEKVIFDGVQEVTDVNGDVTGYTENTTPVTINDGSSFYRWSGRYNRIAENLLEDASWFRLRTVSLRYSLPEAVLSKIGLTSGSLTFTGNNLFVNTPFKGYDPEANTFGSGSNILGFTGFTVPNTKSYLMTLNLKF